MTVKIIEQLLNENNEVWCVYDKDSDLAEVEINTFLTEEEAISYCVKNNANFEILYWGE